MTDRRRCAALAAAALLATVMAMSWSGGVLGDPLGDGRSSGIDDPQGRRPSRTLHQSGECESRDGIDLPNDNPINNGTEERTETPGECCDKCAERSGCKSWVWFKFPDMYNPKGSCWLKGEIPGETECLICVSGVVPGESFPPATASRGFAGCDLLPGLDFKGNDINEDNASPTKNIDECCQLCAQNPDCKTFTRVKRTGRCFLKNAVPGISVCGNCDSGIITSRGTPEEIAPLVDLLQEIVPSSSETSEPSDPTPSSPSPDPTPSSPSPDPTPAPKPSPSPESPTPDSSSSTLECTLQALLGSIDETASTSSSCSR